ncbi:acyltransferase family protein [Sorangium sp. So ce1335]|uniref:acyltransferase family protein n=1 Tax=Sorangium sp. So ce1335 TaxID=3133335 RepID=UPI003F5EFE94
MIHQAAAAGPSIGSRRPQLDALTGLRFLAALHVVLFHFGVPAAASSGSAVAESVARIGFIGVGLFFVLSGFVLAYNYAGDDGGLRGDRRSFVVARFARVYPLFLFALLLTVPSYLAQLVELYGPRVGLIRAVLTGVPALLMLQAWTPFTISSWNGPGWSLSAEAFFYLTFPWIVGRLRCTTWRQLAGAGAALFAVAIAAPLALFIAGRFVPLEATTVRILGGALTLQDLGERTAGFNPLLRLPEFAFGVCLGQYHLARRARGAPLGGGRGAWLTAGSSVVLLALFSFAGHLTDARYVLQIVMFPLFGLLILGLAEGGGALGRVLATRPMIRLGEASYAVYILQVPLWHIFAKALLTPEVRAERSPSALAFFGFTAFLVAASFLAYGFIEAPAREWLKQRLLAGRARPVTSALGT